MYYIGLVIYAGPLSCILGVIGCNIISRMWTNLLNVYTVEPFNVNCFFLRTPSGKKWVTGVQAVTASEVQSIRFRW